VAKETIEVLVEGGKASGGPPLGPALGPTGINVAEVVNQINEKTKDYASMKVPVKVIIDPSEKSFEIEVGSPPTSALIKKEIGLEKGSGDGKPVGNLTFEQLQKVTNMKSDQLLGAEQNAKMKEVIGTCLSLGITVEGRTAKHALEALDRGELDKEMSEEEKKAQEEEDRLRDEAAAEKEKAEEEKKAHAEEVAAAAGEGEKKPEEEAPTEEAMEEAPPETKGEEKKK